MNKEKLQIAFEFAKENGLASIEVDGIRFELPKVAAIAAGPVPELEAADIVKPLSVLDEMTDEEILYWSTNHFDELQFRKDMRAEQLKLEESTRG